MLRFAWGTSLHSRKLAKGSGLRRRRLSRAAGTAVLISTLTAHSPAMAAFDGTVEDLEEGYFLYQAVTACQLTPSDAAMDVLTDEIKRFEATTSESKRQKLWEEVGADMSSVQALGLCEVIGAELQLFEMTYAINTPPPAGLKPTF